MLKEIILYHMYSFTMEDRNLVLTWFMGLSEATVSRKPHAKRQVLRQPLRGVSSSSLFKAFFFSLDI
jgi:hypothetical protein